MRPPLPIPRLILAAVAVLIATAGCQPGSGNHPVPSVPQIGADLNCKNGDHPVEDPQAGWGFCYPGSWRYIERSQPSQSPPGLDLTFDITDYSCTSPAPGGGAPVCSGDAGLFAFMVVSTYERGGSTDLASWIQSNLTNPPASESIGWGNSVEAVKLADGRRIALTQHHVVILDLRPGPLNLEGEMSSRLNTWKFSF
jgi:hypothetical protein